MLGQALDVAIGAVVMVTKEMAYERISGLSDAQVRELVKRRLAGEDTTPVGPAYAHEPPEDLVIELLRFEAVSGDTRDAVIAGCKDVYGQLLGWLASPMVAVEASRWEETIVRLCRVVDVATPAELHGLALSLLFLVRSRCDLPSGYLTATVRAASGYEQRRDAIPLWEDLLEEREVAAYAFNALLAIDPYASRVDRALANLWRKEILSDWPVDTAFLARRTARARASADTIVRVLCELREESWWSALASELDRRAWSQKWLRSLDERIEILPIDDDWISALSMAVDFYCNPQGRFSPAEFFREDRPTPSQRLSGSMQMGRTIDRRWLYEKPLSKETYWVTAIWGHVKYAEPERSQDTQTLVAPDFAAERRYIYEQLQKDKLISQDRIKWRMS